jgi:hypothetical protein
MRWDMLLRLAYHLFHQIFITSKKVHNTNHPTYSYDN